MGTFLETGLPVHFQSSRPPGKIGPRQSQNVHQAEAQCHPPKAERPDHPQAPPHSASGTNLLSPSSSSSTSFNPSPRMYVMTHMLLIVCSMTGPLSFLLVSLPSFLLRLVLILSSSLLVHILSFHFHHLHLQLRPANLKNFKLRLHFELETQYNNLLSFPILIRP